MAKSILLVGILLVVLRVADGQSTTSENSHCSYTFKVPACDCSETPGEDQLMKSLMIALQTQVKLLDRRQEELTDENEKLRQKIATIEAGAVGGSDRSAVNLKQCSMRGDGDQTEHGLILSCELDKKRDDTVLRVVWNGDLRLIHSGSKGGSCRRWFFLINGKECSEPKTIEARLYSSASINIHRPAYVEGYCRGIAAGDVYVSWNVGDCIEQGPYNVGDSWTGWKETVRIIVEEVDVEDADNVIG